VVACYLANVATAWFLNGLGAVLPDLEDHIGRRASAYPLLPGAVLLAWGIVITRRHHSAEPSKPHAPLMIASTFGLAVSVVVMSITRWWWVSAAGGLAAAFTAATLVRMLPATIAMARGDDTERVMMRANAWASVATISAPLAVGGTIALGLGWMPGMAIPIGAAAVAVAMNARPQEHETLSRVEEHHDEADVVPPFAAWWREITVLTMCIMVEFCFAYFAATYLHDELGLSTAASAAGGAAWGVGMTIGRFVVSVRPAPRSIAPSVALIGVGFALLWGVGQPAVAIVGIGLAGLGAAPLYPARVTALLARFPASPDQGATRGGIASGIALLSAPALMAGLRAVSDVRTAYLAVPVLLVALAFLAKPIAPVRPVVAENLAI
jgi:MFS family permease